MYNPKEILTTMIFVVWVETFDYQNIKFDKKELGIKHFQENKDF